MTMNPPNYADQRGHTLRNKPGILVMERIGYGWKFLIEGKSIAFWYDPNNIALDFEEDA